MTFLKSTGCQERLPGYRGNHILSHTPYSPAFVNKQ